MNRDNARSFASWTYALRSLSFAATFGVDRKLAAEDIKMAKSISILVFGNVTQLAKYRHNRNSKMGKLGSLLNTTVGFTVEAASALSHSSQPASTSGSHSYAASPSPYLRSQNPSQFQQTNMQQGLPLPVIIPQRRPQNKSRGWARAYAPALMGAGIDEATFLGFVDRFNEESKASPYLHVVNVAGAGVGFIPGITPMLISMAVPIAVSAAKKAQSTHQSVSPLLHTSTIKC